jgi:hypothetical protein
MRLLRVKNGTFNRSHSESKNKILKAVKKSDILNKPLNKPRINK